MNEYLKKIERATQTPEYQTYGALGAAALVGALFAPTKAAQDDALKQYGGMLQKQADVVRHGR